LIRNETSPLPPGSGRSQNEYERRTPLSAMARSANWPAANTSGSASASRSDSTSPASRSADSTVACRVTTGGAAAPSATAITRSLRTLLWQAST
jgi:hypothetical protein